MFVIHSIAEARALEPLVRDYFILHPTRLLSFDRTREWGQLYVDFEEYADVQLPLMVEDPILVAFRAIVTLVLLEFSEDDDVE